MQKKVKPAVLWKRFLAYLIDVLMISFIVILPLRGFSSGMPQWSGWQMSMMRGWNVIVITLAVAVVTVLYWALLEYYVRQSIGKMVCRIRVQSTGGVLTLRQCVVRNVTKISSVLLLIDVAYMFITHGHQRFVEKLSGTAVVEA